MKGKGHRLSDAPPTEDGVAKEKDTAPAAPVEEDEHKSFVESLVGGFLSSTSDLDQIASAETALGLGMLDALQHVDPTSKMQHAFKALLNTPLRPI